MKTNFEKNNPTSNPSDDDIINCLQIIRSQNLGPITFFKLLEQYHTVQNIIDNFDDIILKSDRGIVKCSRQNAIAEYENVKKFGGKIIIFSDPLYPALLSEISDAPPLISIKGDIELLNNEKIAVVGPRNPSQNAILYAKKFSLLLGQSSVVSVSGMARGVDSAVHEASILSGTIAVLAGGINNIYPQENTKLYHQISECGLIVSEMPFNYTPKSGNFVQRNRIISGLASATVIIEAGIQSGSLTTARFALEQNREVFAVPGSPFDPRCQGSNRLIKEGANIITEVEDILSTTCFKNRQIRKATKISQVKKEYNFSNDEIGLAEKQILANLNNEPINIDLLISRLQIPINLFNTAVMELELYNKVAINYGKIVKLIES